MQVSYYYSNDCSIDALMKWVKDPDEGIFTGYFWWGEEDGWKEDWENTSGFFYGFEPAEKISDKEAEDIMVRKGMDRKKAKAQIEADHKSSEDGSN